MAEQSHDSAGHELAPNMALAHVRKNISQVSPWGMELSVQAGYDTNAWTA